MTICANTVLEFNFKTISDYGICHVIVFKFYIEWTLPTYSSFKKNYITKFDQESIILYQIINSLFQGLFVTISTQLFIPILYFKQFFFFFLRLFFQHHSIVQSLALFLILRAPSKQKICKVFLSALMLTYMRDILVNQKKFNET